MGKKGAVEKLRTRFRLHLRGNSTFFPESYCLCALLIGTSDMTVFVAVLAGNESDLEDTSFKAP